MTAVNPFASNKPTGFGSHFVSGDREGALSGGRSERWGEVEAGAVIVSLVSCKK